MFAHRLTQTPILGEGFRRVYWLLGAGAASCGDLFDFYRGVDLTHDQLKFAGGIGFGFGAHLQPVSVLRRECAARAEIWALRRFQYLRDPTPGQPPPPL